MVPVRLNRSEQGLVVREVDPFTEWYTGNELMSKAYKLASSIIICVQFT